jgi:hypothetical protein
VITGLWMSLCQYTHIVTMWGEELLWFAMNLPLNA